MAFIANKEVGETSKVFYSCIQMQILYNMQYAHTVDTKLLLNETHFNPL